MVFWKKYKMIILFVLLVIAALICTCIRLWGPKPEAEPTNAGISNWGLSFQQEGKCPVTDASKEELLKYDAVFVGGEESNKIYLTFDAGYENGNTASILDTLKEKDVTAAFFLVGNYLESEPELVLRMKNEGHTVGNHTYSHPDMSTILSEDKFREELQKNEKLYYDITGEELDKFYRPPQGKYCADNLIMAKEMGYKTLFWSLAYVDWYQDDQPTREEAFSKLLPRVHGGAVILLHSTSSTNAQILPELIDKYRAMGYEFSDIKELF